MNTCMGVDHASLGEWGGRPPWAGGRGVARKHVFVLTCYTVQVLGTWRLWVFVPIFFTC